MTPSKRVRVHRFEASSPDDVSGLDTAMQQGLLDPRCIVAILGKTEGNGCVNDFTRGFASRALKDFLCRTTSNSAAEIGSQVALVMSGCTEGGLSPHWLVFEVLDAQTGRRIATWWRFRSPNCVATNAAWCWACCAAACCRWLQRSSPKRW